jgi:exonuclease III
MIWNARDLNCRVRRSVVRDIVEQQRISVVCLQESKLETLPVTINFEITGIDFDYAYLPAVGVAEGAFVAWRRDLWEASPPCIRRFSVSVCLTPLNGLGEPWWLTNVYGPTVSADKVEFLDEIRATRASSPGPWLIYGDFNMIYQACDKNNGRLPRGIMRSFRGVLDDLQLDELHLHGRLFTWSKHRDNPTLERS